VLVIGHQPTLGLAASYLVSGQTQPWTLRKGAFIWLRAREREGVTQVVLHASLGVDLI
jgi:phosphohistidine phosphatase